uniref:Gamma-tubulin complex component 6 n=1 Tax=Gouania willdenowi TaxID=441366 RepID=A0A8C5D5H3_GOUWI
MYFSITELLNALCDCSLAGVSWKRRSLGAVSKEIFRRTLKKRAYGALLSKLFPDATKGLIQKLSVTTNTPPRNKVLMICFDLRVAGCQEEAEMLEEKLELLLKVASSELKEVDAVLDLLVHLAGSVPTPQTSFSKDYMRRERPVLRRPSTWSYQSEELQRLEARAWGLVCGEEWGALQSLCGTQRMIEAPPGTGLLALKLKSEAEERFEKDTRLTLYGALQHTRTADMDIRLDLPPVPSNVDVTGLSIRVPSCLDQSEDEGFQSASNLTPDSQSESSPKPDIDIWDAAWTFEPGRRRCWESVGCPPGERDSLYLTEAGREAFDQLYRLWEGEVRIVSMDTPSPILPLPLDSQTQLVSDLLNVLIGVESTTFILNKSIHFDVRPGVCVSGASPESVSRLLGELAQYGTHYLRLSRFSLQSANKKGLVFQAFTGGLRKYLHYYQACVLSTPPTLSLLTICFLFRKVGRQLRYLSELCGVDEGQATFPVGVKLLSYLYNEAQSNCSNENYPVLLSLLRSSCEPYTRFVSDWVYSGVFRDVYKEFMIQVNQEFLGHRDKHFWVQGYTLISKDVEDCVPIFLGHIANDVYVCGKTINLLKICCPQHYICWSELSLPRIAVTFSLQEVEEIEKACAVYRGRMEQVAKHSAISFMSFAVYVWLNNWLFSFSPPAGRQVSQHLAEEAKKRKCFEEQKQHLEQEQKVRQFDRTTKEDDFSFARELKDRMMRLQALEEQLEQTARKELIAQYSRLSEEAARREGRALWRVQRMRLDEARVKFFMEDRKNQNSALQDPSDQQTSLNQDHEPVSPSLDLSLQSQTTPSESVLIPKGNNFLPKLPKSDSQQVDATLQGIGSTACEPCPTGLLVDYDFSINLSSLEGITGQTSVQLRPLLDAALPATNSHGHPSDSHIRIGKHMSEVVAHIPAPNVYGHASDSHIRVGENVSEFVALLPAPNVHGHISESHIRVGELVSDRVAALPLPNIHGHSSDAHIIVGENVSDVVIGLPPPSIHGHSSDANIKVGGFMSDVPEARPRWSAHGNASDSALQLGCVVSRDEPKRPPLPGSIYGHSSDSSLGIGCVVAMPEPLPSPLPGSAHGHSSDSTLGGGCVVLGMEPPRSVLPGSAHGHSSDSTLAVGCVVKSKSGENQWQGLNPAGNLQEGAEPTVTSAEQPEQDYLSALCAQYQVEHYEDCYDLMASLPECQLLKQVTRGLVEPALHTATDTTAVQLSEMVSLPVLIKHSVTAPLITHVSLVNKAVVDYFFVELGVERHFEALRHFLLMEDGEFAQSLSDLLFEKLGSGQTPGELLTPLVLNSILSKALQFSLHGESPLAGNFTFALRFLPETFHPHAPDSLNCLELRYKVDWPLNIIITDSCMNKYNRLFSFLLQLKHMVWSLRDVWFHLKRTALVKGAGCSVQFHQLQLYRHEMQHFVKVIQGYIANQILQVSWSEFTAKLATASDLDAIHRTHADYLNRAIFRGLLTEKAAPVMNIIHSIFSLILKFRAQLISQPWGSQQGEALHPSFIAMQQSYNTFKYYSHFLFKVVTKLVNRGYQPHLEDFLLRINFNNYYKDS